MSRDARSPAIEAALRRADAARVRRTTASADARDSARSPSRWFAIGDPQASARRFFAVLDHHGLLGADGGLAPDVGLVSMGDHFDYPHEAGAGEAEARVEGCRILAWLASHPAEQVAILLGNHDAVRVQELAPLDADRFATASALAHRVGDEDAPEAEADFRAAFPDLPPSEQLRRDFASFTTEQRDLVMALLLEGRIGLALSGRLADGREALFTHAGVSIRECEHLGARDAPGLATALADFLAERIAWVRDDWEAGRPSRLDLAPLHVAGSAGREGGGLLFHRPAAESANGDADGTATARRRFPPEELPPGLVQVCGHTGHRKFSKRARHWVRPSAESMSLGHLRTLIVDSGGVRYEAGVQPAPPEAAVVVMIDGTLARAEVADYQLLAFEPSRTQPFASASGTGGNKA